MEQTCRLFYLKRACDSSAAIWQHNPGVTEPKRKNTEEKGKEGDKEGETSTKKAKVRKFSEKWKTDREWLQYDDCRTHAKEKQCYEI